jgi:hypothetical protein
VWQEAVEMMGYHSGDYLMTYGKDDFKNRKSTLVDLTSSKLFEKTIRNSLLLENTWQK